MVPRWPRPPRNCPAPPEFGHQLLALDHHRHRALVDLHRRHLAVGREGQRVVAVEPLAPALAAVEVLDGAVGRAVAAHAGAVDAPDRRPAAVGLHPVRQHLGQGAEDQRRDGVADQVARGPAAVARGFRMEPAGAASVHGMAQPSLLGEAGSSRHFKRVQAVGDAVVRGHVDAVLHLRRGAGVVDVDAVVVDVHGGTQDDVAVNAVQHHLGGVDAVRHGADRLAHVGFGPRRRWRGPGRAGSPACTRPGTPRPRAASPRWRRPWS